MFVHSATPYCRWVFEAVAIVGTASPTGVFSSETMATTQICKSIQGVRKENLRRTASIRRCISTVDKGVAALLLRHYRNETEVPNG
jgi:hypothetical protein